MKTIKNVTVKGLVKSQNERQNERLYSTQGKEIHRLKSRKTETDLRKRNEGFSGLGYEFAGLGFRESTRMVNQEDLVGDLKKTNEGFSGLEYEQSSRLSPEDELIKNRYTVYDKK